MASSENVKAVLEEWDIEQTELLLEKLDEVKTKRTQEDLDRRAFEIEQLVKYYLNNCV